MTLPVRVLALTAFLCLSSGVAPVLQDDADCPAGCFCDKRRGDSLLNKQVLFSFLISFQNIDKVLLILQDGIKVHCVQLKNENLDPSDLPDNTIQLDLNHYGLESLTEQFFARVKYLEKVDLSNNNIVYIEEVNIYPTQIK